MNRLQFLLCTCTSICVLSTSVIAQVPNAGAMVDDKKAKALIEAGDARFDAGELSAALDLYKSMLDRYPTSKWRFLAHLKIGKQSLKEKKFDQALDAFRRVAVEENQDANEVADASLEVGICYFEMGKYEEAFGELRKVIKEYPGTPYSNDAYYYIGQAHFKLGRFGNAIEAFKNVGTSIDPNAPESSKLDAGKRLYVKIEDRDLSAQAGNTGVAATVQAASGDKETVTCLPVTPGAPLLMGSLRTELGEPKPGDGIVQILGTDKIDVTSLDRQTAEAKLDVPRKTQIQVVGNARVKIVDGAFAEPVGAVVLDKPSFLLVSDADRDLSGKSDQIEVILRAKRLVQEAAPAADSANANDSTETMLNAEPRYDTVDEVKLKLVEKPDEKAAPGTAVHTGFFVGTTTVASGEQKAGDELLQAAVGDILEMEYADEINIEPKPISRKITARVIEGNLNPLQVANANISDEELKFKTALRTSEALKNIGNIYKELGLSKQATEKFKQALSETEQVAKNYGSLNQRLLEQTYVQMWKIYYAMDDFNRAAQMCLELQRRFPESPFVDEALLQMGQVSQKKGDYLAAIGVYRRLAAIKNSPLAPAAQYAIGECYADLGSQKKSNAYYDEAFLSFKTCFENFPNSNQAGDALSKMAEYYYSKEDFTRAVDLYEQALAQYQDSKFIDVVLYNYGRCLVKMKELGAAKDKFNQLITTYPNSTLVANSQKLVEAIDKRMGEPAAAANN